MKTLESILDADLDLDITVMTDFLDLYLHKNIKIKETMKWTQKMHQVYEFQPYIAKLPHDRAVVIIRNPQINKGMAMVNITYWSDKKSCWVDVDLAGNTKGKIVFYSVVYPKGALNANQFDINFAVPCNIIQDYINKAEERL